MKVHITAEAEADLEQIADHIALDDPQRALAFVRELRAACLGLADFPERFALVPRFADLQVRHRVHGKYLIFYRLERQGVFVLHVLHGAMDYSGIDFPAG